MKFILAFFLLTSSCFAQKMLVYDMHLLETNTVLNDGKVRITQFIAWKKFIDKNDRPALKLVGCMVIRESNWAGTPDEMSFDGEYFFLFFPPNKIVRSKTHLITRTNYDVEIVWRNAGLPIYGVFSNALTRPD